MTLSDGYGTKIRNCVESRHVAERCGCPAEPLIDMQTGRIVVRRMSCNRYCVDL